MEIVVIILTLAVAWLIIDRVIVKFHRKDELARRAIKKLGEEFNFDVWLCDGLDQVSIYPKDIRLGFEEAKEKVSMSQVKEIERRLKIGDESIVQAVNSLAKYLGVELNREEKPATSEVVVKKLIVKKTV